MRIHAWFIFMLLNVEKFGVCSLFSSAISFGFMVNFDFQENFPFSLVFFWSFVCWEIFSKASVRSLGVLNINLFDRLLICLMFGIFPPEHTVSFGYNGDTGPGNWGNLSPHYETCSNGKWQSPVDIVKEKVVRNKSLKPLIRDYSPANATLINHGFNIAVCSCSWTSK